MSTNFHPNSAAERLIFQRFIPASLSRTMRNSYDSLPLSRAGVQSYHDDEKNSSSTSSSSPIDDRFEKASLLKQFFIWLTIVIIFTFAFTTTIVLAGTSSIRNASINSASHRIFHPAQKVQPLDLEKERQKALAMLPNPSHPPKHAKSCGPDAEAAMAKGCHLDMISFTWLPHECYDHDLTAEFLSLNPWQWALDQNGTELVTQEKIESGEIDNGWVTFEYHITHCLYTWKKLVRHLERGGAMDWYVMEYSHTRHCSDLLLHEGTNRQDFNSEFFVQFPLCGYV